MRTRETEISGGQGKPACLIHCPCSCGNDSDNHETGAVRACGHENVSHGKSVLAGPGCGECGRERFRPAQCAHGERMTGPAAVKANVTVNVVPRSTRVLSCRGPSPCPRLPGF